MRGEHHDPSIGQVNPSHDRLARAPPQVNIRRVVSTESPRNVEYLVGRFG
jgi:hypothetical protein